METTWPTARDLMTPKPITLSTDAPVSRALGLMRTESIHEVPILRNRRLVGMITFETIARRTNLPLSTKVEHLMVLPPLITVATTYPELAEQLLAAGLRAAPVVGKRGELVGIVSRTDLVRALPDLPSLADHRVDEMASPVGLLLREDAPCGGLFPQVRLLEEHPLPVTDHRGRIVGAVGIADLGRILWRPMGGGKRDAPRYGRVADMKIGSIMHAPALTIGRGTTAGAAARAMTKAHVSSAFLVEDGRPTGVVSQTDLLGLAIGQGEAAGSQLGDVYVQVHGLRGSGDPQMLTEIDRLIAKGLRHISRHARPTLLSLNVSPHSARSGDATVDVRLQTDRGMFYASQTSWNFFASVSNALDEIEAQVRRSHESSRRDRRHSSRNLSTDDEMPADTEVEAKIRAAAGDDDLGV